MTPKTIGKKLGKSDVGLSGEGVWAVKITPSYIRPRGT